MITELDVFEAFQRAKSKVSGRGFTLPKDWEKYLATKMSKNNAASLYKMMAHFNTTLSNIDMDKYMDVGFQIWPKRFSYNKFCDPKILNLYMSIDKQKKREMNASIEQIDSTFEYLKKEMSTRPKREGYGQLQNFCKFRDGEVRIIINTYLKGKIDAMTLTYCIFRRYLSLTDDERALTPYVADRYRDLVENLQEVKTYIERKEMELNEHTN